MHKKYLLFLFILFTIQFLSAQKKRAYISGVIENDLLQPIEDAYILNRTTKKGTVSNSDGYFEIPVKIGDWLVISNIQYQEKKIHIKANVLKTKTIKIHLLTVVNQIEEVIIKKEMTGRLAQDRKKAKKDKIADLVESMSQFFKNLKKIDVMNMKLTKDELHLRKPPNPGTLKGFKGVGVGVGFDMYGTAKKRALRKKLNLKAAFPEKLKKELGAYFFFTTLKIPKEKFYHFITYCSQFNIEQLYKNKKIMALITIFKRESVGYLKNIQNKK